MGGGGGRGGSGVSPNNYNITWVAGSFWPPISDNVIHWPPLIEKCNWLRASIYFLLLLIKVKRSLFLAQLCLWHCLLYFECVVEYLKQKRNSKGWSWFSRTFHSAQLFGFDNLTWSCYISYTMKMIQLLNLQINFFLTKSQPSFCQRKLIPTVREALQKLVKFRKIS